MTAIERQGTGTPRAGRRNRTSPARRGCRRLPALLLGVILLPASAFAGVTHSTNPENGLQGWHFREGNIEIELIQRLPDQTRALFMQHAFSRELVEAFATSCMFQTIIRNRGESGSDTAVVVDLADWRMRHAGNTGPICG